MNDRQVKSSFPSVGAQELVTVQFGDGGQLRQEPGEVLKALTTEVASLGQSGYGEELVKIAVGALFELVSDFSDPELSKLPSLMQLADFQLVYGDTEGSPVESSLAERVLDAYRAKLEVSAAEDEPLEDRPTVRDTVEYALAIHRSGQVQAFVDQQGVTGASTFYEALMFAIEGRREIEVVSSTGPGFDIISNPDPALSLPRKDPYRGRSSALALVEEVDQSTREAIGLSNSQLSAAIVQFGLSPQDLDDLAAARAGSGLRSGAVLALYEEGNTPHEVALAASVQAALQAGEGETSRIKIREFHESRPMTDDDRTKFEANNRVIDLTVYTAFVNYFGLDNEIPGIEDDIAQAIDWAVDTFGKGNKPNIEKALLLAIRTAEELEITTVDKFMRQVAEGDEDASLGDDSEG